MERKSKLQMIAVDKLHPHPRTYEKLSFIYVDYNSKTISRKNSPDLNKFYALLCKLGYVMSDEEIQLRDGTHPIFTSGEVK